MGEARQPTDPQTAYASLVALLRAGARLPPASIREALAAAGKTYEALVNEAFVATVAPGPQPGDPCECGGSIVVRTSRRQGNCQVQFLHCPKCGQSAGRRVVPATAIRRRRKSVVVTTQERQGATRGAVEFGQRDANHKHKVTR